MRWVVKSISDLFSGQRGISLIEVLLAVAMLGLIGTGVIRAYGTNYRANRVLDEQVTATNLATAYIEAIKQGTFADNYTSATANITIPAQYSVVIDTYGTNNFTGQSTVWVNPSSGQTFQQIHISVTRGGKEVFSICTYRSKR